MITALSSIYCREKKDTSSSRKPWRTMSFPSWSLMSHTQPSFPGSCTICLTSHHKRSALQPLCRWLRREERRALGNTQGCLSCPRSFCLTTAPSHCQSHPHELSHSQHTHVLGNVAHFERETPPNSHLMMQKVQAKSSSKGIFPWSGEGHAQLSPVPHWVSPCYT